LLKLASRANKGKEINDGPFEYISFISQTLKEKCNATDHSWFLKIENIEKTLQNSASHKLK
jgi:hypothetical protein